MRRSQAGARSPTPSMPRAGISCQLMHAGRMSHPDNTPHRRGVAPSAIAPGTGMFTPTGMQDIPTPRPDHRRSAPDRAGLSPRRPRAIEAGAGRSDRSANAYLIQQFWPQRQYAQRQIWQQHREPRPLRHRVARHCRRIGADFAIASRQHHHVRGSTKGPDGRPLSLSDRGTGQTGPVLCPRHASGRRALLADIRRLWQRVLIVNRPGRPRDQIGSDIAARLADMEAYGAMILPTPTSSSGSKPARR